jgi:hypothetical protein
MDSEDRPRYRVSMSSSASTTGAEQQIFEGSLFELRKRFPVEQFKESLNEHKEVSPPKDQTFFFYLRMKTGNEWHLCTTDPRF